MITIHCTRKAQKRLTMSFVEDIPNTESRLGNWYCNEFTYNRSKYLLFTNENTLLSIIISVKSSKNIEGYIDLFCQRFFKIMFNWNVPQAAIEHELEQIKEVVFAKTQSRSVLGSMNDIVICASDYSDSSGTTPDSPETFSQLARLPMGVLKYINPKKVTLEALLNQ